MKNKILFSIKKSRRKTEQLDTSEKPVKMTDKVFLFL